jgi:hypothetical protein
VIGSVSIQSLQQHRIVHRVPWASPFHTLSVCCGVLDQRPAVAPGKPGADGIGIVPRRAPPRSASVVRCGVRARGGSARNVVEECSPAACAVDASSRLAVNCCYDVRPRLLPDGVLACFSHVARHVCSTRQIHEPTCLPIALIHRAECANPARWSVDVRAGATVADAAKRCKPGQRFARACSVSRSLPTQTCPGSKGYVNLQVLGSDPD